MLLRRGVDNTRGSASDAQAEERSHLSGVFGGSSPRGCRQYAVSRGQVGRGRFQRRSGDRSRAVRSQDLPLESFVTAPSLGIMSAIGHPTTFSTALISRLVAMV